MIETKDRFKEALNTQFNISLSAHQEDVRTWSTDNAPYLYFQMYQTYR